MADFATLTHLENSLSIFFLCFEIGLDSGILIFFPFFFYLNCIFCLLGGNEFVTFVMNAMVRYISISIRSKTLSETRSKMFLIA